MLAVQTDFLFSAFFSLHFGSRTRGEKPTTTGLKLGCCEGMATGYSWAANMSRLETHQFDCSIVMAHGLECTKKLRKWQVKRAEVIDIDLTFVRVLTTMRHYLQARIYIYIYNLYIWPLQNIQACSVGNSGGLSALFERAFCGRKSETNLKSPLLDGRSQLPRHTGLSQSSSYWPVNMMGYIRKIVAARIWKHPARSDVTSANLSVSSVYSFVEKSISGKVPANTQKQQTLHGGTENLGQLHVDCNPIT